MPRVVQEHPVILGNVVRQVGEQRDVDLPEPALLPRRVYPGQVREVRVDGTRDDFGVDLPELLDPVAERQDLGRAHERAGETNNNRSAIEPTSGDDDNLQVQRVEEEHQVLALEVRRLQLHELAVDDGGALPVRRRLRN